MPRAVPPRAVPPHPSDRGQALPLLLVVLALAVAAALAVGEVAIAAVERGRAQQAADAAALAGAVAGEAAADAAASANGAALVGYRPAAGEVVEVEVRYRRAHATATAEVEGGRAGAPAGGDRAGLAPVVLAALARADQLLGEPVPVVSGFRSRAEQEVLWETRSTNPYPVAPPGSSTHEVGLAIDVPADFMTRLLVVAADAGLCQPLPAADPVHFEPCPPTTPA